MTGVPDLVPVPRDALAKLVAVARHVSLGARAAFVQPYPDATARFALGALNDAGLLEQFRADDDTDLGDEFAAHADESLALANEAFESVVETWPKE